MVTISKCGDILLANESASVLLGWSSKELVGKNIKELCAEPTRWDRIKRRLDRSGHLRGSPFNLISKSGARKNCLIYSSVLRVPQEGIRIYECVFYDMSKHDLAVESLREREEQYRMLVNVATDSLWIAKFGQDDIYIHLTYLTDSIASIIGFSSSEVMNLTRDQLMTPSSLELGINVRREQLAMDNKPGVDPSRSWIVERELYHKNGGTVWVESKETFLRDKNGNPIGLVAVTRDITERKRYEAKLRMLSSRLVEVQEVQQRHIARELHDQIGQSLTGIRLLLETIRDMPPQNIKTNIDEAQVLVNDLMDRVKGLSLQLRPTMLDDLGLMPTLLKHFERYKAQTSVSVNFRQRGLQRRFAPDLETAIFRIVQEGLTNVARHACIRSVRVQIVVNKTSLVVEIKDRGVGFDPLVVLTCGTGSGITGMQERAAILGGQVKVDSKPGVGTHLRAEFPLELSRA